MAWTFMHSTTWLSAVTVIKAWIIENVTIFKTNVSKKQGFVDHNLDHKKVLAFMSLQKF